MMRGAALATLSYLALIGTAACRSDTERPGPNNNNNNNNPGFTCPGDGVTVCDLKYDLSPEHPAASDPVQLTGLLVTTPRLLVSETSSLSGFYVQDQESVQGEYSGIIVIFGPDVDTSQIEVGDVIDVNGTFEVFGENPPQKQLKALSISETGRASVTPLEINDPNTIADKSEAYEGVLLKVSEVSITAAC